jgi:hypothetical protein
LHPFDFVVDVAYYLLLKILSGNFVVDRMREALAVGAKQGTARFSSDLLEKDDFALTLKALVLFLFVSAVECSTVEALERGRVKFYWLLGDLGVRFADFGGIFRGRKFHLGNGETWGVGMRL